MKKFALLLSIMLLAVGAHANEEDLQNIPPTYDFQEGEFMIDLPMFCKDDAASVMDMANERGYKLVFLGEQLSQAGSTLYVTVFLHPEQRDYYVFFTNKTTGAICEVTSGGFGDAYPLIDGEVI